MLLDRVNALANCQIIGSVGRGKHLLYMVEYDSGRVEMIQKYGIHKHVLLSYYRTQARRGSNDSVPSTSSQSSTCEPPGHSNGGNQNSPSNNRASSPIPGPSSGHSQGPVKTPRFARIPKLSSASQPGPSRDAVPVNGYHTPSLIRMPRQYPEPAPKRPRVKQTARKSTAMPAGSYLCSKLYKIEKV